MQCESAQRNSSKQQTKFVVRITIPTAEQQLIIEAYQSGLSISQCQSQYPNYPKSQVKYLLIQGGHTRKRRRPPAEMPSEEERLAAIQEIRQQWTQEAKGRKWVGRYATKRSRVNSDMNHY